MIRKLFKNEFLTTIFLSLLIGIFVLSLGVLSAVKNINSNQKQLMRIETMRFTNEMAYLYNSEQGFYKEVSKKLKSFISDNSNINNAVLVNENNDVFCMVNDVYADYLPEDPKDDLFLVENEAFVYVREISSQDIDGYLVLLADNAVEKGYKEAITIFSAFVGAVLFVCVFVVFGILRFIISLVFKKKNYLNTVCTMSFIISVIVVNFAICFFSIGLYEDNYETCKEIVDNFCETTIEHLDYSKEVESLFLKEVANNVDFVDEVVYDGQEITLIMNNDLINTTFTNYLLQTLMLIVLAFVLFHELSSYFAIMRECARLENE